MQIYRFYNAKGRQIIPQATKLVRLKVSIPTYSRKYVMNGNARFVMNEAGCKHTRVRRVHVHVTPNAFLYARIDMVIALT